MECSSGWPFGKVVAGSVGWSGVGWSGRGGAPTMQGGGRWRVLPARHMISCNPRHPALCKGNRRARGLVTPCWAALHELCSPRPAALRCAAHPTPRCAALPLQGSAGPGHHATGHRAARGGQHAAAAGGARRPTGAHALAAAAARWARWVAGEGVKRADHRRLLRWGWCVCGVVVGGGGWVVGGGWMVGLWG